MNSMDFITTDNYSNKKLKFFYSIPDHILGSGKSFPLLACIPGLSGKGEVFACDAIRQFAISKEMVLISPSFCWDKDNFDSFSSYQYPDAWSGDALKRIVEKIEIMANIKANKFHFLGFSAGAQFALRYSLLWPNQVETCSAHASGGLIIPTISCPVHFFITVGTEDPRIHNVEMFYGIGRKLNMDVILKTYPVGHRLTDSQIEHSLEYISRFL